MGLEIHGMVYAFDAPDDEALNNTVFFNYKIFNRSQKDYHDTYIAVWDDMDIGSGWEIEGFKGNPDCAYFNTTYKIAADFENLLRMIFVGRIRTHYIWKL